MRLQSRQRRAAKTYASWIFVPRLIVFIAVFGAFLFLSSLPAWASASNVFIAQNSTGAANGADCADAFPVTWFNTTANWGTGGTQIGPGTIVHLCGTFTGTAGQTMLTTRGAGTSGHPVVLLFETGAVFTAPYWGTNDGTKPTGGAITLANNYTTVDGGANGIIQNTANGEGLTYQAISAGVVINGCTNTCEVRNLTISNIYVKVAYSATIFSAAYGIYTTAANLSNILIHGNTINDSSDNITLTYSTGSNYQVYNNTLTHSCASIAIGDNNTGNTLNGLYVHDNNIYDGYVWWDSPDACHINGMHLWAAHTSSSISNMQVYNNYVHGNMSGGCGVSNCWSHVTSFIFLEGTGGGTITAPIIFNNVIATTSTGDGASNGLLSCQSACTNPQVYNNTVIGNGLANGVLLRATGITFESNLVANFDYMLYVDTGTITLSNNNVYYNWVSGWKLGASNYSSFAAWQGAGQDANGMQGNPDLDTTYHLLAGSPAINTAANLTALGITPLDSDKAGKLRPSSSMWDGGAYASGTSASLPAAPFGLTAIVN